ncbi:hypothetical protein, partial [Pseudonocardia oceani]
AGIVWALNRPPADETPAADAGETTTTAVEEPQVDDPVTELTSHASEALLATCTEDVVVGDGAPVRATANCSDWGFDLYSSAGEAATVVRDNNGSSIEPGTPCESRPPTDAYHVQRFDRGVLGCRSYEGGYTIEFAVEGVPVVGIRDEGDDGETYEVVYAEALSLSAEVS